MNFRLLYFPMAGKKSKKPQVRLSSAERRQMIILKAGTLFAEKGIHGVTTKEIAKACEVSEPVLYQHFATKEDLYNELHTLCKGDTTVVKKALARREVSTETLCFFVYLITSIIATYKLPGDKESSQDTLNIVRLTGYSFLEDGRFLTTVLKDCIGSLFDDWQKNYKAALKNGDLEISTIDSKDLWVAYELMIGGSLFNLVGQRHLPQLHADEKDYLERMSVFTLRGLGVKDSTIKKHFKPKVWTAEIQQLLQN